jgi:hypothetical protein
LSFEFSAMDHTLLTEHQLFLALKKKDLTQDASLLQELTITSDEALSLEELPKRALILCGRYRTKLIC